MRYRRLAASALLVLLLGLVGSLAGPGWNPEPLEHTIVPQTPDTAVAPELDVPTEPVGTYEVEREVVDVEVADGVVVQATVASPVGAQEGRPGLLLMHGAGTQSHRNFHDITSALASAGVVTMVPDKRADTYTTQRRDYVAMARDYLASFAVLREWPGVDPERVGVYGESEGAMSAPVAAAEGEGVAFVILVSAPVLPIREQGAFAADNYLRDVGVPSRLLRAIPRLVGGSFPGGGFEYFDFDVRPYQQRLDQPVMMAYGGGDTSMPIVQGAQALIEDLATAGNDAYAIRYYPEANHGLRVDGDLVPEFPRDLARWIQGLPETAGAPPMVAGAEPLQAFRADPLDRPRWYATGDMILYTFAGGLGLIVLGVLAGLARGAVALRRLRTVRGLGAPAVRRPPGPGRLAAALTLATLATWVLYVAYLAGVAYLALNYERDTVLVQGGWLVVQATGVLAAVMVVLTLAAVLRRRRHRASRGGVPAALGSLSVGALLLGCLVLLLSAAYWGVYPAVW